MMPTTFLTWQNKKSSHSSSTEIFTALLEDVNHDSPSFDSITEGGSDALLVFSVVGASEFRFLNVH